MLKGKEKKGEKGGLSYTQVFSAMIIIVMASTALLVFTSESSFNAEMVKLLAEKRIVEAYANKIMTDSCLIANTSIEGKRMFVLNRSKIDSLKDGGTLDCIDNDNVKYVINITIYSPDFQSVIMKKTLKNVENKKMNQTIVYHVTTDDGFPAEVIFDYLNITNIM